MKKTFNINVAGYPFTIDDDAYSLLNDYLDTIEHAFARQEETRELINDIESRIAELLLERTASGSPIVTAEDVEEVIRRVGQPEEMIEEDETLSIEDESGENTDTRTYDETVTPPPYIPPMPKTKKKLFRDPQNAMLGGVCSGFAWYFNSDPTLIRLICVLLTIISVATMGIAYLILWIVIPEARTPLERMQMMGEQPTVENIGKTVTDNFREESLQSQPQYMSARPTGFGDTLANFFGLCARILVIVGLIIAIPILAAMAIGLVGCIFALIMFSTSWGWSLFGEATPSWYEEAGSIPLWGIICGIGSILALGIPLFLLIRMGMKKNRTPLSKNVRTILTALWIIGFLVGGFAGGRIINLADEKDREFRERLDMERQKWEEEDAQIEEIFTDPIPSDSVATDSLKTGVDLSTDTDPVNNDVTMKTE